SVTPTASPTAPPTPTTTPQITASPTASPTSPPTPFPSVTAAPTMTAVPLTDQTPVALGPLPAGAALLPASATVTPSMLATGPVAVAARVPDGDGRTYVDLRFTDASGNPVTTFSSPIALTLRCSEADLRQVNGEVLRLAPVYVIDAESPAIENPLGFPAGTFVLFPPANVAPDGDAATVTVTTHALGSAV